MSRHHVSAENVYDTFDIFTELYDSVHAGVTHDIPFYVEEAQRSSYPVLEVGCGTGRVLLPVAEAGIPVVGIDISQAMLTICRRKVAGLCPNVQARITLLQADMRDLALAERFGLIYLPNQTFLSLLTLDDQLRALCTLRRHLQDGGRLALDFFDPDLKTISEGLAEFRGTLRTGRVGNSGSDEITRLDNGNKVMHWFRSSWHPASQIVDHTIIVEELSPAGTVIGRYYVHHVLRWMYRYEFEHLLHRCGFELEAVYGAADRQPHTCMGQHLFWLAKKVPYPAGGR